MSRLDAHQPPTPVMAMEEDGSGESAQQSPDAAGCGEDGEVGVEGVCGESGVQSVEHQPPVSKIEKSAKNHVPFLVFRQSTDDLEFPEVVVGGKKPTKTNKYVEVDVGRSLNDPQGGSYRAEIGTNGLELIAKNDRQVFAKLSVSLFDVCTLRACFSRELTSRCTCRCRPSCIARTAPRGSLSSRTTTIANHS